MELEWEHIEFVKNGGGGDCLFLSIKQALDCLGVHTTVGGLRRTVAESMDQDKFESLSTIYRLAQKQREIEILSDYAFMARVVDLDTLRKAIMTRSYYGDEMALDAIEARYPRIRYEIIIQDGQRFRVSARLTKSDAPYTILLLLDASLPHYELLLYRGFALYPTKRMDEIIHDPVSKDGERPV